MRNILSLAFLLSLVVACTSQAPVAHVPSINPMVRALEDQTVALYSLDSTEHPVCTGVWVSSHKILTAAHCISVGEPMLYSTAPEYKGVWVEPLRLRASWLVKADLDHDLAMFETGMDTPAHQSAVMAWSRPLVGDGLFFMGHPAGITWSFRRGVVAHYREASFEDEWVGPWMQVQAPIYFGDSGGGVFNESGELVGICHSIAAKVPNTGFMITQDTVRTFLQ